MPGNKALPDDGRIKGKTGLEASDNARRDFIVTLAERLRNLDDPIAILEQAAKSLGEFLLAERAGAYCITDGEIVHLASWTAGRVPPFKGTRPIATIGPKIMEKYRARQTAVTGDVVAEGMKVPVTYSAVGVPLFRKGRWEGTFYINREAGRPWRAGEISLAEEVAELSWDAHQRALAAEKLRAANEALRRRESELAAALHAAALVPFDFDMTGGVMKQSAELNRLYGYPPGQALTLADIRARYHPDMTEAALKEIAAQLADPNVREYALNLHLLLPGGKNRWLNGRGEYFRDEHGKVTRAVGVVMDVTEQRELEQTQRLLVQELDHRIKNVLTTVLAICTQTIRNSETLHGARHSLVERITALSSAHDVLVKTKWGPAAIGDVIAGSSAPYPELARRVSLSGPDCMLSAKQALMLGLALHELITNALKYGALSNDTGAISVSWALAGAREHELVFAWREAGGPAVTPPLRTGFGTRLLSEVLPAEFTGQSMIEYAREGFRFRMEGKLADVPG
ncbi:MAG TPA: HWE histidine kinase domain-containing protein [Rhizomicrobium sp.]|nr:HWE histidine kinase domain-containing protein [Rhizomicrobium sp.]